MLMPRCFRFIQDPWDGVLTNIASIPFFMALYEAFKVLGYVRALRQIFSQAIVNSLRDYSS